MRNPADFSRVLIRDESKRILCICMPKFVRRWVLPGGKIEPHETPIQCAIREVKEELNLDIKNVRKVLRWEYDFKYDGDKEVGHFYFATADMNNMHIREEEKEKLSEVRFFSEQEILADPDVFHVAIPKIIRKQRCQ